MATSTSTSLAELLAATMGKWTTFPGFDGGGGNVFTFFFSSEEERKEFIRFYDQAGIEMDNRSQATLRKDRTYEESGLFWLTMTTAQPVSERIKEATRSYLMYKSYGYSRDEIYQHLRITEDISCTRNQVMEAIRSLAADGVIEKNSDYRRYADNEAVWWMADRQYR